ncbi:MAG TPA: FAD-dependent monooxygenase [Steroidobacteraceae bacterium]|nr:FAD-dependent monooxygenase [Steroidobacteraceae bacterium]
MAAVEKVLIIGGGIGGLSTAISLRRADIEVDLVEINKAGNVCHVGIVMQGNAIRAMAALGIAERCVAAGFSCDGMTFEDLHGRVLADFRGVRLAGPALPSDLGLSGPALRDVLTETARALGARIRLGVTFSEIVPTEAAVHVSFTDGASAAYDLVVGADGVNSQTRAAMFGAPPAPHFTGQGVWRYTVPRPSDIHRPFLVKGIPGGSAGFIPLSDDTGNVLLVQSEPGNPQFPADRLAELFRARLATCTGVLAKLRGQIIDSRQVIYRPLHSIFMPAPWYRGRVLLIGDAAHAMTPHLGQGAAQAMEDAVVLGELLAGAAPLPDRLETFMARRYERCKLVYEASIQVGEWEQHPTPDANPACLRARIAGVYARPI